MPLTQLIIYLLLAIAATALTEGIFGRHARGGVIMTGILSLLGAWLSVQLVRFTIVGEPVVSGIPLLSAAIGAGVAALLWGIIAAPRQSQRRY